MVLEEALSDLAEAYRFYDRQSEGLGAYFLDSLWSDIDSLHGFAGIHPIRFGYHRLLSKRFPFAVYYRMNADEVMICAVLDCRRNPTWVHSRLN